MPRKARVAPGGQIYHVMNRSAGRIKLFRNDREFAAFENIIAETLDRQPMRILAYCLMPTHWSFVVWPRKDGELSGFFRWLAHTHVMRWRVAHRTVGGGPLYQSRFKSFIVQRDRRMLDICRHVERNPVSAALVRRADRWRWSSLWTRGHADAPLHGFLSDWPVDRPRDWPQRVNEPMAPAELDRIAVSIRRSRPYGDDRWVKRTVTRLGLEHTLRPEGRPRKTQNQKD